MTVERRGILDGAGSLRPLRADGSDLSLQQVLVAYRLNLVGHVASLQRCKGTDSALKCYRIFVRLFASGGKGRKSVAMRVDTRLRISTKARQLQEQLSNQLCFSRSLV